MFKEKLFGEFISDKKGSLISGPFGSNISSKYFIKEGVPVIRGNNLSLDYIKFIDDGFAFVSQEKADELNTYATKDDIVFTAVGTLGQVGIIPEKRKFENYVISNKQIRVRLDTTKLDPLFAFYWFSSPWMIETIKSRNVGSTVPLINLSIVRNLPVRAPDNIKDQQKIASVLSALDNKIELNNKINTELEAMAKTLYDYWFIQFDFPDANGKPYKSSGGNMVWNDALKREIPEGWEVKRLASFINSDKSGDWGKEKIQGNYTVKVECIRGADINGINGKGDIKAPVRYILEKNKHKLLSANDFVVEISGGSPTQSTGRITCITKEVLSRFKNPLICSNFCKAVSLKDEDEVMYFLSAWNKAYDNNVLFGFEGKTSGIKNLLFENFTNAYMLVKPPSKLIRDFNNKLSLFEKKRQQNLKQNQELATLRDWLLPMLMNGQVTVGESEEKMGMVAEGSVAYTRI